MRWCVYIIHKFLENSHIIHICIKNSAGIMLTKEIEDYIQQWNYIKIRQTKTKNLDDLFSCSVMT